MTRAIPDCPGCGEPLDRVTYDGGQTTLNREQWMSARAGDWWCPTCPHNGRGRSGAYYWAADLPLVPGAAVTVMAGPGQGETGRVVAVPPGHVLIDIGGGDLHIVPHTDLRRIE